jgi:hypothetical protein
LHFGEASKFRNAWFWENYSKRGFQLGQLVENLGYDCSTDARRQDLVFFGEETELRAYASYDFSALLVCHAGKYGG